MVAKEPSFVGRGLTDDDMQVFAELLVSLPSGSLAQLKVSSHPTDPFPARRAFVCALA